MRKIISKSNSKAVRSMDVQVTILFKVHEDSYTRSLKHSFPLHLTFLKSIGINSSLFHTTLPNATRSRHNFSGPGISPLVAWSTFNLWLPPYRTARITSVCSHSSVYTPKEGSKHCRGTDCFKGTSYMYLKAVYQRYSFSWKGSKTTQSWKLW